MKTQTRDDITRALRAIIRQSLYYSRTDVPSFGATFYVVTAQSLSRMLHYAGATVDAKRCGSLIQSKGLAVAVLATANALTFSTDTLEALSKEAEQYATYSQGVLASV